MATTSKNATTTNGGGATLVVKPSKAATVEVVSVSGDEMVLKIKGINAGGSLSKSGKTFTFLADKVAYLQASGAAAAIQILGYHK